MTYHLSPAAVGIASPVAHTASFSRFFEHFSKKIEHFSVRYLRSNPWADKDDLLQAGKIALWGALQDFDQRLGKPFEHFATVVIRNAIADEARRSVPAYVRLRKMAGLDPYQMAFGEDYEGVVTEHVDAGIESVNNPNPSAVRFDFFAEAETGGGTGVAAERTEPDLPSGSAALKAYAELMCDSRAGDHTQHALKDPTFDSCLYTELEQWVAGFSNQYQRVFHLHFCAGSTHQEVAEEIGVSRQRVSTIAAQLVEAWRARNGTKVH